MNDIRWGDITVDTEKKEEYLNSLSKQQLISFFKSQSLSYISLLNNDKIDEIIGEPAIQERLVSAGDKWLERSILLEKIFSKLNRSNVLHFLNDHMLELIRLGHLRHSFVLNLLASPNPYISYCLEETKFFELLLNDDSFIQLYDHMSEETVKCFFQYILKIDEEKINFITRISTKRQWIVIQSIGLPEFYKYFKKYDLLFGLDNGVITKLLEHDPYRAYFTSLPTKDIVSLVMSGICLPFTISNDKALLQKLSTIEDPNLYRLLCYELLYTPYESPLYAKKRENALAEEYHKAHNMPLLGTDLERVDEVDDELNSSTFSTLYLEQKRKKYYDDLVSRLELTDYMMPEYYDIMIGKTQIDKLWLTKMSDDNNQQKIKDDNFSMEDLVNLLNDLSTSKLLEILVDRYFEDITYNFLINLNNLLGFYQSIDISALGLNEQELEELKERIGIYNQIHSFYDLTPEDQVKLYQSFDKTKDYACMFYDDISLARHTAYDLMNQYAFTPDKRKDLFSKDLSKKYGVDVYELTGQEFYAYVHVTRHEREEPGLESIWGDLQEEYIENPESLQNIKSGASISFMSDKKLDIGPDGRKPDHFITVGFNYLVPERIAHVSYGDSWSEYYRNGVGTERVSEIMTPETLMEHTRNYNEILYQEITPLLFDEDVQKKYHKLKPDYFVCYDEITDVDVRLSKIYSIPILLIRTNEYNFVKDNYSFYNDPHQYKKNIHQLSRINSYRRK